MQSPFAGFHLTDCYDLYHPDRLHQWDMGVLHHVASIVEGKLSGAEVKSINTYLKTLPSYSWYKTPSFGLATKKKSTGTEFHNLFALLPVALLALPQRKFLVNVIAVCIGDVLTWHGVCHVKSAGFGTACLLHFNLLNF